MINRGKRPHQKALTMKQRLLFSPQGFLMRAARRAKQGYECYDHEDIGTSGIKVEQLHTGCLQLRGCVRNGAL
jgi:hypothetical protein